jgi:hypothetical protein
LVEDIDVKRRIRAAQDAKEPGAAGFAEEGGGKGFGRHPGEEVQVADTGA